MTSDIVVSREDWLTAVAVALVVLMGLVILAWNLAPEPCGDSSAVRTTTTSDGRCPDPLGTQQSGQTGM